MIGWQGIGVWIYPFSVAVLFPSVLQALRRPYGLCVGESTKTQKFTNKAEGKIFQASDGLLGLTIVCA